MWQSYAKEPFGAAGLPALRVLVSSGEPLPLSLLRQLDALLPEPATILNLYGSTECAADVTWLDARRWLQQQDAAQQHAQPGVHAEQPDQAAANSAGTSSKATASEAVQQGSQAVPEQGVPVGQPIDNMAVFIAQPLREDMPSSAADVACRSEGCTLLRRGALGEVCVAGVGVAEGYLG